MQNPQSTSTGHLSHDDYFALEQREDRRFEYLAGEVFAMAGGSERHALISSNILTHLSLSLRQRPCRIYGSDMKLHIETYDKFCYPDVQVLCEQGRRFKKYVEAPCLVIEVLSDGTESYDRGMKFEQYRVIPELRYYLLVDQQRTHTELYTRQGHGAWLLTEVSRIEETVRLESLDCEIPLTEIYRNVELAEDLTYTSHGHV